MSDFGYFAQTYLEEGPGVPVSVARDLYSSWLGEQVPDRTFTTLAKEYGLAVGMVDLTGDGKRTRILKDVVLDEAAVDTWRDEVRQEKHPLAKCETCPLRNAPYVNSVDSDTGYWLVGEAPGRTEAMKGLPLAGKGLRVLSGMVKRANLPELEGAGVTNVVACYPDGNVPAAAVEACAPRLEAELAGAERVVAMGTAAARHFTGSSDSIQDLRAQGLVPGGEGWEHLHVLPTYSPWQVVFAPRNMSRMQADLDGATRAVKRWTLPDIVEPRDETQAVRLLEQLRDLSPRILALDIETASPPRVPGKKKGVLITKPERIRVIGLATTPDTVVILGEDALASPTVQLVLDQALRQHHLLAHNGKFDLQVLEYHGYGPLKLAADTMLAGYAMDPSKGGKGLESMSIQHLDSPPWKDMLHGEDGERWDYDTVPHSRLVRYNARDVANTYRLWMVVAPMLERRGQRGLHDFLCRASDMLMRAESAGLLLDPEWHCEAMERLTVEEDQALRDLREAAGDPDLNPNSHAQLKRALARELGYRPKSTVKNELMRLEAKAPNLVRPLLAYRKVAKLRSTYIGPLGEMRWRGRVHANFNIIRTDTGRLSSDDPNFQNIPKPERGLFVASAGRVFVSRDLSQAELRVIAEESGDEGLADIFRRGADLHGEVAAQLYGEYTVEQRRKAKTVVFGVAYGRTAYGISMDPTLGMGQDEAEALIEAYFRRFPRVRAWQKHIQDLVRKGETLATRFGRKYTPPAPWTYQDDYQRASEERAAMAFIPQSTASDITLLGAVLLAEQGAPVRVLVHDDIVLEVPEHEVDHWLAAGEAALLEAGRTYTETVPFVSDAEVTHRWGHKEDV